MKNAPAAETFGAEVGAMAVLIPGVEVYANVGLLHAKITEYPGSGFQGNELPMSPAATASAGVTLDRDRWDASFNVHYSGSYFSDIENNPRGNVDPYWQANLQLGWRYQQWRIYGHLDNVFDSGKALAIYSGPTPEEDGANILAPRSYWLAAQWSWQ